MKKNNRSKDSRIEWVDSAKAFACILVVLGHLLQSILVITPTGIIGSVRFINWYIYLFHMPLFMCLSGFMYSYKSRIKSANDYKKFELKKACNLIIPYVTFYSITMILNMAFTNYVNSPKGIQEWLGMLNNPISPYWFLYALLSIFIVVPLLEKLFKNKKIVMIVFTIMKIVSIFYSTKIYAIDSIAIYGIYFYIGVFIKDSMIKEKKELYFIGYILYFICAILIYKYVYPYQKNMKLIYSLITILMAVIGTIVSINICKCTKSNVLMNSYKKYTFQVYLMHTIFAAGTRILLYVIGVRNWYIHFVLGMIASIYIPVLISHISNKLKITNFFFFPSKTMEEYRKVGN